MTRVLVIAAHPDDELLGLGGTLIKHVRDGYEVHVVIMSEGASSRYEDGMKNKLKESAYKAGGAMGVKQVHFCDMPDQRMDGIPLLDVIKPIEALIKQIEPEIIYVHHHGDVNQDHRVVFEATMVAARPVKGSSIRKILCYETPSSTEWCPPFSDRVFVPNVFVDIEDSIEQKLNAFQCYESELREFPHPRSLEAIRNTASQWGSKVGLEYAEAFELIRWVK
ncbi:PIG-L family deacetylase [bacterium]|nr:PIG-L family deacetylase [bacterium]MBU1752342.1 PIG-L family deacetylase [bacterium]